VWDFKGKSELDQVFCEFSGLIFDRQLLMVINAGHTSAQWLLLGAGIITVAMI